MTGLRVSNKEVKELCTEDVEVREAYNQKGVLLYVKFLRLNRIDELGISQCLEFNRALMGQIDEYLFPQHFLKIEEEITNNQVTGFVTKPYEMNLSKYCKGNKLNEKQALQIFDQILKAIYSLHVEGFATRNLRTQHFVRNKDRIWQIQSLIYSHEYQKASGNDSEYLWSPRHQAPECFGKEKYEDDDFNPMLVWNLGSILVELLTCTHKFSTLQIMKRFKDKPFSFAALGMKPHTYKDISQKTQQLLSYMLHYNPEKRMTLEQVFSEQELSFQVAKHFNKSRPSPVPRINFGKSSVRINPSVNKNNAQALNLVSQRLQQNQDKREKTLRASKIGNVIGQTQFQMELGEISTRIPQKNAVVGLHHSQPEVEEGHSPSKQGATRSRLQELVQCNTSNIRKSLQLYKSYFDQSQLLNQATEVMADMLFPALHPSQIKQLKKLIKLSVTLVSLINLNSLAEGFNQNRNIFNIPANEYILFSKSDEFFAFQKVINFRRTERVNDLTNAKEELMALTDRPITNKNSFIADMIKANYRNTNFQKIKTAYRFIVKHAYDQISQQYNERKKTGQGAALARIAMYVTYCLTIDKLYMKEDLSDNFKFFFKWANKPPSSYVPLDQFKDYLNKAPKQILIDNSRYVLKKYYNI